MAEARLNNQMIRFANCLLRGSVGRLGLMLVQLSTVGCVRARGSAPWWSALVVLQCFCEDQVSDRTETQSHHPHSQSTGTAGSFLTVTVSRFENGCLIALVLSENCKVSARNQGFCV